MKIPRIRLYVPDALNEKACVILDDKHAHHVCHVLRHKSGDHVRVFNETDGEWLGILEAISKKEMAVRVTQHLQTAEPLPPLGLICALIKPDRLTFMLEKAVELGVTDLALLTCDNTHVKEPAYQKIQDILMKATQQCERMAPPRLHPTMTLGHLISQGGQSFDGATSAWSMMVAMERTEGRPDHAPLTLEKPPCVLIGPEGGWSEREKAALSKVMPILHLGPLILRAETAAIVGLSYINIMLYHRVNLFI